MDETLRRRHGARGLLFPFSCRSLLSSHPYFAADLKAENVLVNLALRDDKGADEEGDGTAPLRITRVALADFGCAQRLTPETQVLVKRGTRGLGMFGAPV